jgi:crotonobetainyl-CoA:carnitine CoA-transferase CaiB-like acyl-CoA transferase
MAADLKDEKWQRHEIRLVEIEHIIQVLQSWAQTHTVNELVEQGQLMHFPWASVDSLPELLAKPQLIERGFFVELAHPEFGVSFKYPGAPAKFSHSPWCLVRRAPLIGEHNQEIYGEELGFSPQELAALEKAGVI